VRSLCLVIAVACIGLIGAEQALACSCAAISTRDALEQSDAAMNAKLAKIQQTDPSNPNADVKFVYRVRRVFKGARRYDPGDTLTVRTEPTNSCSPSGREGGRYGLLLFRERKRLTVNACGVMSPKKLRRTAEGTAKGRVCAPG
jgi:hypothetical protein